METFIARHVERVKPLEKEASLAHWNASNSGRPEDYEKLERLTLQIRQIYSNSREFAWLKDMRESGQIRDARLGRQLELLYNAYLENQIEPELLKRIVNLSTAISERFSTFRSTIDGTTVTLNDINKILTTETDSRRRELAWRASKQVGKVVGPDLVRLIRLRNEAARKIGFDNYHTLSLVTAEQDRKELDQIFGELDVLTRERFLAAKADLDRILAERYGIPPANLAPWHYHDPFFQRAPLVFGLDLDVYYRNADVREIAGRFYSSIGLSADEILARSDLYERKGKYPHAFSTDIDREGDVRILCNLRNTEQWMETILHELGHAVYSENHDRQEPYLLRTSAHAFVTEGTAMFFGRLSRNAAWMQQMMRFSETERGEVEKASERNMQFQQLIFARWAMVMYDFEKQLYANPDQDLDSLWWKTVAKYQFLNTSSDPPAFGWASKMHFVSAPCYYHNYMLGELFASQLHHRIVHDVLALESDRDVSYVGRRTVGQYLREKIFEPGARYHWNELIQRATGDRLTPKYFAAQFVK